MQTTYLEIYITQTPSFLVTVSLISPESSVILAKSTANFVLEASQECEIRYEAKLQRFRFFTNSTSEEALIVMNHVNLQEILDSQMFV